MTGHILSYMLNFSSKIRVDIYKKHVSYLSTYRKLYSILQSLLLHELDLSVEVYGQNILLIFDEVSFLFRTKTKCSISPTNLTMLQQKKIQSKFESFHHLS